MGKEKEGHRRNGYFLLDLNSFSSSTFLKLGIWDMVICTPILQTFLFFSFLFFGGAACFFAWSLRSRAFHCCNEHVPFQ